MTILMMMMMVIMRRTMMARLTITKVIMIMRLKSRLLVRTIKMMLIMVMTRMGMITSMMVVYEQHSIDCVDG